MQNGFVESFNGRMRDELLNETVFTSMPPGPRRHRRLGGRLQCDQAPFGPGIPNPGGSRRQTQGNRASNAASMRSVFASLPVASAKRRAWRGLTFTTGKPALAKARSSAP